MSEQEFVRPRNNDGARVNLRDEQISISPASPASEKLQHEMLEVPISFEWRRELMNAALAFEQERFSALIRELAYTDTQFLEGGAIDRAEQVIVKNVVSASERLISPELLSKIQGAFDGDELVASALSDLADIFSQFNTFAHTSISFGSTSASLSALRGLRGEEIQELFYFSDEIRTRLCVLANCLP